MRRWRRCRAVRVSMGLNILIRASGAHGIWDLGSGIWGISSPLRCIHLPTRTLQAPPDPRSHLPDPRAKRASLLLCAGLASLATDDLFGVLDALALVWLGR